MTLDFTLKQYTRLLEAIHHSDYTVISIADYIRAKKLPEKYIVIRHDVDIDPEYQLKFAKLEHDFNITATYYFRHTTKIFRENVISKVADMGHEVGYHYEVFTKAKGDPEKAIQIFKEEQAAFSKNWKSQTVCPHGGSFAGKEEGYSLKNIISLLPKLIVGKQVFSKHDNFDMWGYNRFENFNIIGDAYASFDFSNILYLSDTGRSWKQKYKRLDNVKSDITPRFNVGSTNDIIKIIQAGEANKIYLLVHAEQWKDNFPDWLSWYLAQIIRRTGKRLIFKT